MTADVGPVILSYGPDAEASVRRLVGELHRDGVEPESITVVHNPSPSAPRPVGMPDGVTLISPERNLGYAGGMNLGIKDQLAKGRDLVLLITDDVRLEPGAVTRLVGGAARSQGYGVLGPALEWHGRETVASFGGRLTATGAGWLISDTPEDPDGDGITACDYVDGCAVLIRREVLEEIGLLTDRFFMYYEEAELCVRARRGGWLVGVVLAARAAQTSGETKRPGAFNYLMARNGLAFAGLVGGRRAVVAAVGRNLSQSIRLLKMRFSPRSDNDRRRVADESLLGLWSGLKAYFTGQWGPPPADLPGIGDVHR